MQSGSGTHFDARILEPFFANLDEIVAIQQRFREQVPEPCLAPLASLRA